MATVIAYIDGFNLYHGLHERYRRHCLWLDLLGLVQRLRPRDEIITIKYFTALVVNAPDAADRQGIYLDALRAYSGSTLEIVFGRFQGKARSCRACGSSWTHYEEKETDVNIAVSLVADTAAEASDIALVISADSDLCPAIRTARSLPVQRGMIAAFPPRRSSFEIRGLIPAAFTIGQDKLRKSLLPDRVTDPATGAVFKLPDHWY
ncbi:NYN domain-containing protein [Amycolatopsis pigmentata]|uniref:NYN domain-containing protein n=1 Tax=Amycolatopsis pigmentata TaxID=450801 RepID=A0ABW5FWS7_9PSEU